MSLFLFQTCHGNAGLFRGNQTVPIRTVPLQCLQGKWTQCCSIVLAVELLWPEISLSPEAFNIRLAVFLCSSWKCAPWISCWTCVTPAEGVDSVNCTSTLFLNALYSGHITSETRSEATLETVWSIQRQDKLCFVDFLIGYWQINVCHQFLHHLSDFGLNWWLISTECNWTITINNI